MKQLSQCCNKPKVANYSDEGTGAYLCQGCLGEFIPTTPKEEEILREEFRKLNHCGSLQIIEDYILKIRREAIAEEREALKKWAENNAKLWNGQMNYKYIYKFIDLSDLISHLTQE